MGFTKDDPPIRKALNYMTACLRGEWKMDDSWEKTHDWPLFSRLMLSTWVRRFDPESQLALDFARRWARVIEAAFKGGTYSQDNYTRAYASEFSLKPRGGREIGAVNFYPVTLLRGVLSPETERLWLDYILSYPDGIYYIYSTKIAHPPGVFASRDASRWLAGLELLAGYGSAPEKLAFAADWLNGNKDENGQWDFGMKSNDGIYFPLSDSWRKAGDRKADCTFRVSAFLKNSAYKFYSTF